jgi:hypothetical protein
LSNFAFRLTLWHRQLDEQIRAESARRAPDAFRLFRLKRLRLNVKDRLHATAARPIAT